MTALEAALRELRPQSPSLDRDVLMYRAGRAAAHRWLWPGATLLSSMVAVALGLALWMRPAPPIVYVAVPTVQNAELPEAPLPPPSGNDSERGGWARYLHLQEQVFLHGLDGLPAPPSEPEEPPPSLESLLNPL